MLKLDKIKREERKSTLHDKCFVAIIFIFCEGGTYWFLRSFENEQGIRSHLLESR